MTAILRDPTVLWRRALYRWRTTFQRGDIFVLLLTVALLVTPALALHATDWSVDLQVIIPVVIVSVFLGFLLARSHYNELFALILSTLYGAGAVLLIAAIVEPGDLLPNIAVVAGRLFDWLMDIFSDEINPDNLAFTVLVAALFWYLGYNAVWHIFRIDRVWRVLLPPAMILVMNMVIYTGEENLDLYLIPFLFAAMLLLVRSNLDARQWEWYVNGIQVPRRLHWQFFRIGTLLTVAALLMAWLIPSGDIQQRMNSFREFMQSESARQFAEFWNRLIEPIEGEGPATADYYGGDSLNLGGAIRLGDQVVFLVDAPNNNTRYYWRSRVFESYVDGGWRPGWQQAGDGLRVSDSAPPLEINHEPTMLGSARTPVQQTFTISSSPSRLIHAAPQPVSVNVAGQADLRRLYEPDNPQAPVNLSVIRPLRVLEPGSSYTVTSMMSEASAFDLRAAGTDYPAWLLDPADPNMKIFGSISARVIAKAREIVDEAGASNPYDQAKAIETWLRANITYNEAIPPPPPDVDPLEWFLFDVQEGYCTYYASTMIVMLRSLGIPARMAAGFAQGEWDGSLQRWVVRERDAHTWVEAFFPGYGWIEFEPTSAQAPINREGDDQQQLPEAPVLPAATAIPTLTPTPLPSPTPAATSTPASGDTQPPQAPPTATPTPSPTPTVTPVIVPTVPPPVQPPPQNDSFLSFLFQAIGAALLFVLLILAIVLIGLLIYWWWEWRGMGGLSPVARAYARLERYLRLIGLRLGADQTPEERRVSVIDKLPQASRPVSAITHSYTEERYSQRNSARDARNADLADRAWPRVRESILVRWLRRFWPFGRNT